MSGNESVQKEGASMNARIQEYHHKFSHNYEQIQKNYQQVSKTYNGIHQTFSGASRNTAHPSVTTSTEHVSAVFNQASNTHVDPSPIDHSNNSGMSDDSTPNNNAQPDTHEDRPVFDPGLGF